MPRRRKKNKPLLPSKQEGERLLDEGWALIDTSGRTRITAEKNTIALASNNMHYSVHFKAKVKKDVVALLHHKQRKPLDWVNEYMHAVGLFYCLKDHINVLPGVFICSDGFDPSQLVHHLKRLLGEKYNTDKIRIHRSLKTCFKKKNIADRLAYNVNKKLRAPTMQLIMNQILHPR